jgi:phosphoribosyl-ATP pyrophosphohydrolase/phosphoribosyl-AMP cyclohydrolase
MKGSTFLDELKFNADGLIPAIVQDADSGQVLMVAYMNREALERTWETGETWFYSRSRQELWHKGETSGHTQKVRGISLDCDQDALLVKVEQNGAACHEGYATCFFREVDGQGNLRTVGEPVFDPQKVYHLEPAKPAGPALLHTAAAEAVEAAGDAAASKAAAAANMAGIAKTTRAAAGAATAKAAEESADTAETADSAETAGTAEAKAIGAAAAARESIIPELYQVILERQETRPEGSYTAYLFDKGIDKICKKVGEEAAEVIIAAKNRSREELVYESADLIYHLLVLLAEGGIKPAEVFNELAKRR